MKKIATIVLCTLALFAVYACDNSIDKVFDEQTLVEFQPAVLNSNAVNRTYPIISSANSVTASPTITAQVNLVGRQRSSDLTVKVFVDPVATTASANSYTLANGGNVVIPANSSIASLTMTVAKATSATATLANVVLVLDSTSADFKPSQNYKRIGYSIRQ
ncbi:DUF4843 domain-containing protein [Spirosoma rigui]|uniref:DUF4843 domain-containing protein n=1 Tax=Spirosoma rigui TaxID=564064 RepID=UPI0009B149DC|nr:DUF4843 domain-containing protein [Spirosoma rigui]